MSIVLTLIAVVIMLKQVRIELSTLSLEFASGITIQSSDVEAPGDVLPMQLSDTIPGIILPPDHTPPGTCSHDSRFGILPFTLLLLSFMDSQQRRLSIGFVHVEIQAVKPRLGVPWTLNCAHKTTLVDHKLLLIQKQTPQLVGVFLLNQIASCIVRGIRRIRVRSDNIGQASCNEAPVSTRDLNEPVHLPRSGCFLFAVPLVLTIPFIFGIIMSRQKVNGTACIADNEL